MWRFGSEVDPGVWKSVNSPVSQTLHDATHTSNGPCAVGKGGRVIGRAPDGTWGVVVEDGPGANGETLFSVQTSDDGDRIWFAGSNGALGYYDTTNRERRDYSCPLDLENALHALTVSGKRGNEKLLVADGSGNVIPGDLDEGGIHWGPRTKPAGGTAISALAASENGYGFAVDSAGDVWKTTDDDGWTQVGVEDAGCSFYAASAGGGELLVAGGNGMVYATTNTETWTPYDLGNFTVDCIVKRGDQYLAGGGSGNLRYRRGNGDWVPVDHDSSRAIKGVLVGTPNVAVGKGGVILEGRRGTEDGEGDWGGPDPNTQKTDGTQRGSPSPDALHDEYANQ